MAQANKLIMPDGTEVSLGGSEEWELINHTLLEEDATSIKVTFDKKYQELYISAKIVNTSTSTNLGGLVLPCNNERSRQFYCTNTKTKATTYILFCLKRVSNWYTIHWFSTPIEIPPYSNDAVDINSQYSYMISTRRNLSENFNGFEGFSLIGLTFGVTTELYIYGR